jgi:hypothetical protein
MQKNTKKALNKRKEDIRNMIINSEYFLSTKQTIDYTDVYKSAPFQKQLRDLFWNKLELNKENYPNMSEKLLKTIKKIKDLIPKEKKLLSPVNNIGREESRMFDQLKFEFFNMHKTNTNEIILIMKDKKEIILRFHPSGKGAEADIFEFIYKGEFYSTYKYKRKDIKKIIINYCDGESETIENIKKFMNDQEDEFLLD